MCRSFVVSTTSLTVGVKTSTVSDAEVADDELAVKTLIKIRSQSKIEVLKTNLHYGLLCCNSYCIRTPEHPKRKGALFVLL